MWHTELAAAVNAECPCDGSTESTAAPCCSSSRSCPTRPKRAAQNSSWSSLRARFIPTTIGSVAGARPRAAPRVILRECCSCVALPLWVSMCQRGGSTSATMSLAAESRVLSVLHRQSPPALPGTRAESLAKPPPGWVEKRLRAMAIMEIKDSGSYL